MQFVLPHSANSGGENFGGEFDETNVIHWYFTQPIPDLLKYLATYVTLAM